MNSIETAIAQSEVRDSIIKTCQSVFAENKLIEKVFLFGSFSRKEETATSDLDLLVDMKETISLMKFIKLKQELEDKVNRKVDLQTRESISPYILPLITKDLVLIYERKR
ncbi:MAG: nucleotidyltransferase domain-containing protein [Leptospiraceae bacterium]|nr:nucleotidyltransferase domain-containing protein [Leptospiraceae bacterium]